MLKLILPRDILNYIDNNRFEYSRATYIIKCINYLMINNITINNEGKSNEGTEKFK